MDILRLEKFYSKLASSKKTQSTIPCAHKILCCLCLQIKNKFRLIACPALLSRSRTIAGQHSAQSCSFCSANCIRRWFLISIHFVVIKLWVRMPFKKEDSLSALFSLVVLSQMCKRSILRLNLTSILCSELHGQG